MSSKLPPRPAKFHAATTQRFAIVASEYHPEFVQALINNACKELYVLDPHCAIELFGAPGAFEIPVVAEMVAAQRRPDAIIALGLIMQGQTRHAEFIGLSVSHALQQVALKHAVPVIHEVLLVAGEDEARERCIEKKLNRGIEAARAAFVMLRVGQQLKSRKTAR
jgi:6,7-dimethyl-8-ribityllumazine synthase